MNHKTPLLVDADEFIYRACAGNEKEIILNNDHVLHADWGMILFSLDSALGDLREATEMDLIFAISSPTNFRKDIASTYKSNRKATRKPMGMTRARELFLSGEYGECLIQDGLEADDILGQESSSYSMCSSDKDLRTVPGSLYNPTKGTWEVISQVEADRFLVEQVLSGDSADGYPGCPGIGATRAKRALEGLGHPEEMVAVALALYEKAGLDREDMLKQARQAFILRPGYDPGSLPYYWGT